MINKLIIKSLFFLFLVSFQLFLSQNKIIQGKVFDNTNETNFFKIYLLKEDKPYQQGILKLTNNDSPVFKLKIKKSELKKYPFVEIELGNKKSVVLPISNFVKDSILQINISYKKEENVILIKKPAIYLYPEKETQIEVKHNFKGKIHTTYPEYEDGWLVTANLDGVLVNKKDGRKYNYLFWDGYYSFPPSHFQFSDGFYVNKKNYVNFLQEKLSALALNTTEINDFIVFWLPEMNKYEHVFVHFRINDNIDNTSFLKITPKPETMIRVFMEFEKYNGEDKKLPLQNLPKIQRNKFVVVEWGGSEINSSLLK